MAFRFQRSARREFDKQVAYYEKKKPGLGIEFQAEVEQAVAKIDANPQLGSPYRSSEYRHYVVRRFPFVIYYLVEEPAIWIMAVAHSARRPDYWMRRKLI